MSLPLRSVHWDAGKLTILDQTKLPEEITYQSCDNYRMIIEAIRTTRLRVCMPRRTVAHTATRS